MQGKILVIAGSDSGGGAGIQADIKTITSLGGYASTAITSLTAQNTKGVQSTFDIPAQFVGKQISAIISDIGADVIKIGMLSNKEIVEEIIRILESTYCNIPIVLDPVMIAKGGASLLNENAVTTLKTKLIPQSFMVTPNIPEAEILADMEINNHDDMVEVAKKIKLMGTKSVLIKGGHLNGDDIIDILLDSNGLTYFSGRRIKTENTHGTGCTLASAISTYLAQGKNINHSVEKAREYVIKAISNAPNIGSGHGPLNHSYNLEAA